MNRTNSVEPKFSAASQPLSVTYQQLLQSKTRIEEELYQTQRQVNHKNELIIVQLRRKEGEYLKKIAVYEQQIDQMQEQIDEFSQREESMKAMYEKILNALNTPQNDTQMIDVERIQEYLKQIRLNNSPSARSQRSTQRKSRQQNDSLIYEQSQQDKQQIELLESNLTSLTDSYQKVKKELTNKERENQSLVIEIQELKQKLNEINSMGNDKLENHKNLLQQSFDKKINNLEFQHSQAIDIIQREHNLQTTQLEDKIQSLEMVLQQKAKVHQQKQENNYIKESLQKQNQELQIIIDKFKKEKERDDEERAKEKDQYKEQISAHEQNLQRLKKQMNTNVQNNNDTTKRLKQKISEFEKEVTQKNEEISKLKAKISSQKGIVAQRPENIMLERRNSGSGLNTTTQKSQIVSGKDQQIIVDIQTTDKAKKSSGMKQGKTQRGAVGQSSNNGKMFQNINTSQNFDTSVTKSQNQSQTPLYQQLPLQKMSSNSRSQTPNSKQFSTQQQNNEKKPYQSQLEDIQEVFNSSGKQQHHTQLLKYINIQSNNDNKECDMPLQVKHDISRTNLQKASLDKSQQLMSDGEKVLYSSLEIETVVRKMLDQANYESSYNLQTPQAQHPQAVLTPSQYHNMTTPSQNVSFSMRKQSQNDEKRGLQNKQSFVTIDREFLIKLESSLKKLTKSNEKIKQIMKEKEFLDKQCNKLKIKVNHLKEERISFISEKENLISQIHKLECKLKQAQVILNLDGEGPCGNTVLQNNGNNTMYDMSNNSSQKTLVRHFNAGNNRDTSPSCNLTLNIIQDQCQSSERLKNPPMSCRVNDSYDISLRLGGTGRQESQKRPMFHNTLDKSLLDQSLLTLKKDLQYQQMMGSGQNNLNISQNTQMPQLSNKFLPMQSQIGIQGQRGKTPTLKINLSSNQHDAVVYGNNSHQYMQTHQANYRGSQNSSEREDSCCVLTSKNFSRSTSNLQQKRSNQKQHQQQQQTSHDQSNQRLFRYQSNREGILFRSPSNNQEAISHRQHKLSPRQQLNEQRSIAVNQESQVSSVSLLRRLNSTKAKDRYYTRRADFHPSRCSSQLPQQRQYQMKRNLLTFDDEDDSANHIEEQFEEEGRNQMDDDLDDTDENNTYHPLGTQGDERRYIHDLIRESSVNVKINNMKQRDDGMIPSDEKSEDEESVQYKLLNNSNFIPSMHSRYIGDDSQ